MRSRFTAWLSAVLILSMSLLLPSGTWAKKVVTFGSLTITMSDDTALAPTDLVGAAIIANPGLEKTITLQIPPFTFPIAVDTDTNNSGPNNLDTIIVVTNISGDTLEIKLNARNAAGDPIALTPNTFTLDADATIAIRLSTLL